MQEACAEVVDKDFSDVFASLVQCLAVRKVDQEFSVERAPCSIR